MITDEDVASISRLTPQPSSTMHEAARPNTFNKSAAIVNLECIAGQHGSEGQIVYSPSHSAVGLPRSAAKELAPKGIRVNAAAPGMIPTDLPASLPTTKLQERLGNVKTGCLGEPDEVTKSMLFLCSAMPSYITGQPLGVHGGRVS